MLASRFATARLHYQKSVQYLYRHPIDEGNSIKETISTLESIAKSIDPSVSTLGDAIKKFKKEKAYSTHMLDALEKLYVYSNATPMVRHGHSHNDRPTVAEAELALLIGTAFARYFIDVNGAGVKSIGGRK